MGAKSSISLLSISLFLDEPSPLKGPSLASLLPFMPLPFKMHQLPNRTVESAAHLPFMPEIFHRHLSAYSKTEFNIVNQLYRMVEMIRYNFSDGSQVPAKEILRHPFHIHVPEELLPQLKYSIFNMGHFNLSPWTLIQSDNGVEANDDVKSVEEIMQSLLSRITIAHRQKKLSVYLQTHGQSTKSCHLNTIEFDVASELKWRVDIDDRQKFKAQFKLISDRRETFYFYDSYAFEPKNGIIAVHPWKAEFNLLFDHLAILNEHSMEITSPTGPIERSKHGAPTLDTRSEMPHFEIIGERSTKTMIKYLRTQRLPLLFSENSRSVRASESITEVHFNDAGHFTIHHNARVPGQTNLLRHGWSERSVFYFIALSQGLPFVTRTQARDIASHDEFKREWDLALLKHVGILHYILLETLCVAFQGCLTDGTQIAKDAVFSALCPRIKMLLTANENSEPTEKTATLQDLCSRSTLACFEGFIDSIFADIAQPESFYSNDGEVVVDGILERELRLIYEILKSLALISNGGAFKKARTGFLSRITKTHINSESALSLATYHFPETTLHAALDIAHSLIPFGFKILLKGQPIHELAENDLEMTFHIENRIDQSQINWFELNPKFFLHGHEVDADNILRVGTGGVIEYENKYYLLPKLQMPTLRLLEEFWKNLQRGNEESSKRKKHRHHYQLPRSQTLYLLALRKSGVSFQGDAAWDDLCQFYDQLGNSSHTPPLPQTLTSILKPYQKIGVRWLRDLYELRLGALLADDMGLGKTVQTLSFLESLREDKHLGPVLIVVPSSLIFNWQEEIQKFTPEIRLVIFQAERRESIAQITAQKQSMVVLITYGLMLEHSDVLVRHPWNVIIFDEAQAIKNIHSKRTGVARALRARFKIALTGTPMENHFGEFYSLIDLLVPGCLGTWDDFYRAYVSSPVIDYELIKALKLTIKPLILRRTKSEILSQLPPKQETAVKLAFEEEQKEIYRNIALSYNRRIHEALASQGVAEVQLEMLTALLRLRQACSDPASLPNCVYKKIPPKLETLTDSLKEIMAIGESALIFTQFLQTLERTADLLRAAKIPVFVIHGGISTRQRQKIISAFKSHSNAAVLLMTLRTGGVGLNLTKASYVFHIEPWWNPAVENQATDRVHRIGQTKPVHVFNYIMHESLEEKIEILKERKANRFDSLFTHQETTATFDAATNNTLSKDDFDYLITLS